VNRQLCDGRGSPWRTAGDDAKMLFYKGFSFRYALVTAYYTYPEPTPDNEEPSIPATATAQT